MITIISETFEIVLDFYRMRKKELSEKIFIIGVPLLIGVFAFIIGVCVSKNWETSILEFTIDFINQIITVLALFISFSIAYIGMLITSNSKVIEDMKQKDSKHYFIKGKAVKVYQSIHCMMTYTVLVEVMFMVVVFAEKFLVYLLSNMQLKILLCVNLVVLIHIIILLGMQIRDIYFSFWRG